MLQDLSIVPLLPQGPRLVMEVVPEINRETMQVTDQAMDQGVDQDGVDGIGAVGSKS